MAMDTDKFNSDLVGVKVIAYTYHSTPKHRLTKKYVKPQLYSWILLLQEVEFEIWDTKGADNSVADHLSRLQVLSSMRSHCLEYFTYGIPIIFK